VWLVTFTYLLTTSFKAEVDVNEFANLPSIQRLTQEFLCDKYKDQALKDLKNIASQPYPFEDAQSVNEVETMMKEWENKALGTLVQTFLLTLMFSIESFEKDITLCDEAIGEIKKSELHGEINKHMHDISTKFGARFCNQIKVQALNKPKGEVEELTTRLNSGKMLDDLGQLLQQLRDGVLSRSSIGLSVQYTDFFPLSRVRTWCLTQRRKLAVDDR
jgi:hypothetical protein